MLSKINLSSLRDLSDAWASFVDSHPGTRSREVAAALAHLGAAPGWRDAPLIKAVQGALYERWDRHELAETWAHSLDARSEHRMPDAVAKVVGA